MTSKADRVPFADLAAVAPRHDSATCTRNPCGRCRSSHTPTPPASAPLSIRHQTTRTICPYDQLPGPLTRTARYAPPKLAELMLTLAAAITQHGDDRWQRLLAWEKHDIGISLVREEPGTDEDEDGKPTRPALTGKQEQDRAEDATAARYAQDTRTTAHRLATLLDQPPDTWTRIHDTVYRLRFLIAVAEPRRPRQLKSREIQAAQAAADGWCRSCFRVGVFEPITTRPSGEPFYRDLCRWCGSHREGLDQPPADMVRVHHRLPARTRKAS